MIYHDYRETLHSVFNAPSNMWWYLLSALELGSLAADVEHIYRTRKSKASVIGIASHWKGESESERWSEYAKNAEVKPRMNNDIALLVDP